jgi:hypothetical protein
VDLQTAILAAEEDEIVAIGESSRPLAEWSGVERPGIDTGMIAELHCLLSGETLDLALAAYEPVFIADEGVVVLRLADELCQRLAMLDDDDIAPIAAELAAIEEFEVQGWDADAAQDWLLELAELARLADSQGQAIFVWMRRGME